MSVEIDYTHELVNTQYAPPIAIFTDYQENGVLKPLEEVRFTGKKGDFDPVNKLQQLLLSILAGCRTLSEVNPKLKHEVGLAKALGWPRIADQSTLSRLLDGLTQKQIETYDLRFCLERYCFRSFSGVKMTHLCMKKLKCLLFAKNYGLIFSKNRMSF